MEFLNLIVEKRKANKKIWSYCSSYMVIRKVEQICIDNGLAPPRVYHGDNDKQEAETNEAGNHKTHQLIKKEHFSRIEEEFAKHDFIICSPTVGAGIDFSLEHFDMSINLYMADNKSSALSFT